MEEKGSTLTEELQFPLKTESYSEITQEPTVLLSLAYALTSRTHLLTLNFQVSAMSSKFLQE